MLLKARAPRETPQELVFDLLATYRLTTLIKDDKITEDFRNLVFRRYGPPDDRGSKASYLISCPWCLSIYIGALAVMCRRVWPAAWGPLAKALSLSALTGLIAEARQRTTMTTR